MTKYFKDPISGLTHFAGALLGIYGLVYLVTRAAQSGNAWHVVSFAIFGTSIILLYSASSLYHLLNVPDESRLIFRRIDHSMISILIAGTYTPFCLTALRGPWGWSIFAVVWVLAIAGLFQSFFWIHAPRWLTTGMYLFMGWLALAAAYPLYISLSPKGLFWMVAGGIFYSVGAVIYGVKKPDPFPPVFGFHEIWHLFVLAGTASHFLSVCTLV